jgi:hypothetical protein
MDEAAVLAVERQMGVRLPELLRMVYTSIGDGGFGPGYGLLPLSPLKAEPDQDSVLGLISGVLETGSGGAILGVAAAVGAVPRLGLCHSVVCGLFVEGRRGGDVRSEYPSSWRAAGSQLPWEVVTAEGRKATRSHASESPSPGEGMEPERPGQMRIAGVRIWDLMFEPDPAQARAGINPIIRQPMTFVP